MQTTTGYTAKRRNVTEITITGNGGSTRVVVSKFKGWEQCDAGSLAIVGEYGPWEHRWTSIGEGTFGEFLSGLDMHYTMKKLAGTEIYEFDLDATRHAVRRHILETRRCAGISKSLARECFDRAGEMTGLSAEEAYADAGEVVLWDLFRGDPIVSNRVCANIRHFWDSLWPLIVQEILAEEAATTTIKQP